MSKLSDYLLDNTNIQDVPEGAAPGYEDSANSDSSSSGSFFDGAKKWLGEYIDAVSEGRPMWKSEATIKPVDWGTAGGNGSMPTTFSNSTYQSMQNPDTTLSDVGNAVANRVAEITPDALKPQVIAPNWQPRPLDDSVYSDTPGTPTADGQFGALEDENERQKRMNEAAQWAADNIPRAYSAMLGAVSGAANVTGGIRNALGGENSDWILRNAEKSEEAMKKFRQQWENQYGDSGYLLNPNGLVNDIGNGIGSSVPIMALSLLAPEAAVGVGTRAITSALTRAGLGRLAGSKAGQALIADVVRSPLSTAGDTMAEYGSTADELAQEYINQGMSKEDAIAKAREQATSIIPRNIALDTLTLPGELYVMKGAKGLGRRFQAASTDSIGKRIEKGMARAGLMSVGSAIPEGYQEGAQNALEDNVKGERDTNWFSPFSWTGEDWEAARGGAVGGAFMGIPGNVAKGMQTYSNTGNAGIDATVDAANEYGLDPKGLLAIGARESGGDDVTAIGSNTGSDDPNDHNMFQITDESASDYGVDKMYPDWKTDPRQNALAAAFILTKKIDENGGDFWAGVRAYNGAGPAADEYLATVQNTYNNISDDYVSSGGGIQPYNLPTQSAAIDEQVSNLTPEFQSALPTIGGILNEMGLADGATISSAARTPEHNAKVGGAENSYHVHNDAVDIVLPEGTTQEQADAVAERFRNTGAFKEVLFHDAGSGYHLHLGGYNGGLNSRGGAGGTVESTYKGDGGAAYMEEQREADRQYQQEQRDRDNAYQQEINNIMNDNTSETIANDVDKEMKEAKAQQEESMKALTPEQQKEEISDYLDSVSQDDISDEDFNALWDATQSNDPKQIQTAYQTVQDAKKAQTAKPIKTEDTPVLKSVQKQKQPAQQGTISTENTSANQTEPNTQPAQDNKQTQPLEQTVQPPLNTAPNSNPIHAQQGAMNNETTQSTQSTNNQNVNTKPEQNQRENAETVQAQKSTENQGTTGIIENVRTDNAKQNIPAQYKLVSADDVISSDMPAYPQQYQPRNRNRLGMVAQVEDMSNQLNPSAVVDQTGNVNMGAPVINSKGVVLNGNGRTMAIRKAYSKGNKSAQAYKQYLKDNAEKLGLDPTAVDKIKNPMIVRQVADDAPIEDIIHSTAGGSRMSASEQAKSDAKKIRTATLDKYKKENPPDLSAPSNRAFVKSILDDITTDADRNAMYTESGQITKEAIRRVQDALFARAYGDDSLLNRMTESTDDNIRIVSKVMLQCAPKVAKLKEGQEHGDFYSEYDVSNVITQAAKDLIEARDAGKPISYKLRENDMFETSKRKDDEAIKITLKFFDDNKRKPRRIQEYVNSLADYVIGMGSPKFETESNPLFDGGDRMTMNELANFAEEEINGGRNSNLHVEGERTDTETKSVPQTVQEESGTAGNGSVQESNGTEVVTQNHKAEVKENVALQPVKNAIAKGDYKLIAKEALQYANDIVTGLKDDTLTKEQAQLRVNDLVSALKTKESNGNIVMGNIPKFMQNTILDALKMAKDAIKGNIEYAGMNKKETEAAKMLDETIKGIKDGSITPAKADDGLRNARVAAKENGKQSYAFSKKLKEAEDFIKDKNNYGTEQEEREAAASKEETKVKQEEPVQKKETPAQKQEETKEAKHEETEKESEPERTSDDEIDLRTISIEDAEREAMEALGIKPHKKPVLPKPTKGTPKPKKKTAIKDDETLTLHIVDQSDEALAEALKVFDEEASKLNANPMFNPRLMTAAMKIGAIHLQRGANKFIDWLKAMGSTDSRLKSYAPAVWKALQAFPKNGTLNEKQMTSLIHFVGVMYHHGITDKTDLRKRFIAALGVKNARYFDTAYTAIVEYPTAEELKGDSANVNDSTGGLVTRTSEGNNQNAVGTNDESRRPSSGNGQNISQTGKRQEQHNVGNTGIHADSTTTSGKTGNSRVQEKESNDSTGSTGSADLSGSVRDSLAGVPSDEQKRPDELSTSVKNGRIDESNNKQVTNAHDSKHIESIRKEVPILKPEQAGDVAFAERRLIDNNKNGVLFTNGTGTGKTFSGLGIIKRMYDKGKKNIIVVAPNTNIIKQWVDAAKGHFGIEMTPLENVKDSGKEVCITTFANFGYNHELAKKDWDLVVCDESQNLMSGANANPTNALRTLRAITHHEEGFTRWLKDTHSELWDELQKASEIDGKEKTEESKKKYDEAYKKWNNAELEAKKDYPGLKKSKVVFLSATPFAYVPNIDYANGYLFNYGGEKNTGGYNQPNGKEQFFINHFGYKMRYNRLEKPDADVDSGIMEREFHDWLEKQGALSGRQLVIDKDYDRGFIRIDGGIGKVIDEGREYVLKKYPGVAYITQAENKANPIFDKYMLEAIKAKAAVELVKEYIKQGKKVVVFHDFKVGGAYHPFKKDESKLSGDFLEEYRRFAADRPDLVNLDLSDLKAPIVRFKEAFGNDGTLAIFNGDVSKKNREKAQKDFNDDNGKAKVILVQSDAGQAGISLHDTTGKYQRVLINLGMPTKPTASIQIEGRIYRTGNKSNAIIRYLNTGTNIEQNAFASRIAERASTAENLALGNKARALKKAFIDGFEESQDSDEWEKYLPGSPTEGTGGKEKDRANDDAEHAEWDKAKSKYFANQKKTSSNKSREGIDYYATPEPLGLKMVEWAQPKANQSMLEPSAGHGAIAQWFPNNTKNTVVEPSNNLVPKLQMHVDNANVVNNYFENIGTWNKFDRIVMNPPFGKGGKTAIEHLAKAYKHLREGGRIVALIPDGPACQKHFDKWFWEDGKGTNRNGKEVTTKAPSKTGVIREEIALPSVTFERAGTKVNTKIVIIDKFPSKEAAKNYNDMTVNVDMRDYSNIKDFFNALENKTVPDVLTDTENNEKQKDEQKEVKATPAETQIKESTSAKTETTKEQKTGKLTDDEIEALENNGFNRWTKGDMDRLYIKPTYLGLDLEYYKSGNISSATFNGESISNSEGRRLNATKCYVDVVTRKVVCDNEELKQAAQELLDTVLGNTKYSVRGNSEEIQRSMQEVKDEIKNALPTAKDVTEDGNTITFTMPNGSKIAVDVQNQIALTEEQLSQAKKDHNINGNVVVEGYAQKYGKDAYIALSQGSRKGTGYHEVYHVAEDAVLNDKEKAALRKKYPNEEVRADKYAEWVEARKHGKGTLFGKLFRKIQDFAKKMQAILTRTENVHNVFRKIESGEVWNRKASESNLSKYNLGIIAKERLEEDKKSWNKVVNDFTRGEIKKDVPYKIMHTPLVLQMIGAKDAPFMVDGAKIYHLMEHDESISPSILKELPNKIADPIMVINSYAGRKVALLDLKGKNKASVIAIVELNKKRNRYDVSLLNNMYSKNNAIKSQTGTWIQKEGTNFEWFYKNIKDGNVIYKNNKKSTQWIQSEGSYSPNQGNALDALSKLSIPNETDLDNLRKANPTKYSIRKTQDKTPLNPKEREQEQRKEDILKAINEIVPVYTKSDVKKNAVTETYYDRRQKVGFVKTPTIREYGRILALNLDQQLKLKNNMELTTNVKQELEKNQSYAALMGDKIKDMTPVQARAEGVSIFGSLYFNGNEEAAAARFPKYYEAFKNALKEDKELNDKVNHITEMIGDYKAQNPVLRANSGMQMHDESQKKTTKGKINAILDNVYAEMVDELDPLTKITKLAEKEAQQKLLYKYDVHKQALMAQGNAQSKANLLLNSGKDKEEAIHALNDKDMFNGAVQYKVNMNDIMDAIKNVPQEELEKIEADDARQGLAKYLIAMRTEELSNVLDNEYVRPDGFDEEACHTIIKDAPESIKTAAKMVWDFNKNMINIMQQQGLINKKAADTMRKYTYYVPMYHDMSDMQDIDDFIGAVGKGGRGFVDIKPNIYEIKGGNERAIIDPIESMVRMTVTLLNKCQRNRVGQALARINQDFEGMGSIIAKDPTLKHEDPKKCAFSVYVGGKKVIYRTTPEVYTILTDVDETGASVLESVLKPFASALRRGATISPPFIVRNFTRDTVTAGITSQTGFIPFVDSFRGMYKLTTDKQFKMDYLASGASMGTFIRSDVHGAKDLLSEITGDKYSSWPKGLKQIAQFISAVWNHYDKFANLVEDGTRAGEFMRARKKGIGLEEAGYLAKEVTLNFGRHGKAGKHANRIIPFFNATIQGTDKFIRAFKKNPARASFMTAVTIILPSIIAWALANGSDDDWYQDLDANTKYTNWCFKIGDSHILIPKPQEAGILFGSGVEAVLNQMMSNDPQAMKQWAKQYVEALLPNIVPTLAAPIVEWIFNYSMWKGRNLVPESLRKHEPSEYQYNSYTSEIAKALGDTMLAKEIKLSPIAIDNFISGYFGSAGRFIANMLNSPVDYLRDSSRPVEPAKYWYEMPFVGSFVRRNHENSEYQNRFYDLASDMTDDYNRMKHDNPKAKPPKGYKEMETAKKTVSKLNKEISEIKSDTKMGPEQKLQQIELRQNKIRHFTKKFVTQYGK